jgi:hypothetical protein
MDRTITDDERPELEPPILQGLAQVVPQVDPPFELRARVLTVASSRTPAAVRSSPAPVGWWLATAAGLALAAGLGIYTAQLRSQIVSLEAELRDTRARADAAQQQMAEVQRTSADAQTALAILTAPDVARVDLAGQPASPNASGRAFWSRSRGLVFNASNLPPLPAGRIYQLWVVTAQAPISAGLLTPDAQGSFSDTFDTPPDIPPPVAVAVTIEPAGGVPAPTGDRYLVGAL